MSKKSNVHPDHYKTDGRDRPDDAARARLNRAIAAKVTSQQRPDRMGKEFYFERPEPARLEPAGEPGERAGKRTPARKGASRKTVAPKGAAKKKVAQKTPAARRANPRKTASIARTPKVAKKK